MSQQKQLISFKFSKLELHQLIRAANLLAKKRSDQNVENWELVNEAYMLIAEGKRVNRKGISDFKFYLNTINSITYNKRRRRDNNNTCIDDHINIIGYLKTPYLVIEQQQEEKLILNEIKKIKSKDERNTAYLIIFKGIIEPRKIAAILLINIDRAYYLKKKVKQRFNLTL